MTRNFSFPLVFEPKNNANNNFVEVKGVKRKGKLKDAKGFTIIEVALVLAIAGLIFLVVFLALPALQRSQRDNARRQDASRIATALQNCMANSMGDLTVNHPSCYQAVVWRINYTDDQLAVQSPDWVGGKLSQITDSYSTASIMQPQTYTRANIIEGGVCNGSQATLTADRAKNAAVLVKIESGSFYCVGM